MPSLGPAGFTPDWPGPPPTAWAGTDTAGAPKTSTLTDDFATQDAVKWNGYGGGVVATAGRLQITPTNAYPGIRSANKFDLGWSSAIVEAVQTPNLGTGTTEMFLFVEVDSTGANRVSIRYSGGNLVFTEITAGVVDETSIPYDAVAHRWWRVADDNGTLVWSTSFNGWDWTARRTKARTIPTVASCDVALASGYYGTEPTPGTAVFDNLNLSPRLLFAPVIARMRPAVAFAVRRPRPVAVVPAQVTVLASDPTDRVSAVRRTVASRRRPVVTAVPLEQPRPPAPSSSSRRPRIPVRRDLLGSSVGPAPAQTVVPPVWVPQRPAVRRILAVAVRRRPAAAPLDQQSPPATRAARIRARILGRPRAAVVPPQQVVAPPAYPPTRLSPRRLGILRRRPAAVAVVPAQVAAPAAPAWVAQRSTSRRVAALTRRTRPSAVPADQGAPPAAVTRRLRLVWRRPARAALPVPAQVTVAPPAYPPRGVRVAVRGLLGRRGRGTSPVPPQVAPAVTPSIPSATSPRRMGRILRRPAAVAVVPPQAAAPAPAYIPTPGRVRRLTAALRRPRAVRPVTAQDGPPRATSRHPVAPLVKVRHAASPPIPQAAPPPRPPSARRTAARIVRSRLRNPFGGAGLAPIIRLGSITAGVRRAATADAGRTASSTATGGATKGATADTSARSASDLTAGTRTGSTIEGS